MLDIDKLTLGEIAAIEDKAGLPIDSIADDTAPKGKMLAALAWVTKRRAGDPTYKWDSALSLTMDEAQEILGLNEGVDAENPTE